MNSEPNFLVIRRRYLGDVVLIGSLLRNLKLHHPQARISVLCEAAYADVLKLNPDVDETLAFPSRLTDWFLTVHEMRKRQFTHVLDIDNRDKTALLTRLSGAPIRVTLTHGRRIHFPSFYTQSVIIPGSFLDDRHITELYLRLLELIDVPLTTRDCRLVPRTEDLSAIQKVLQNLAPHLSHPRILVHPGSRSPWRVWPPANFAKALDALMESNPNSVVLVAGPGERATVDAICAEMTIKPARIDQNLTLPQLAALFASFDLLVCHDSGPMHLASAVGTRVVALYGSQKIAHWRPLGQANTTLQPPLPCKNCVSPGACNPADAYFNHCVRNITVERVISAVNAVISPKI